MQRDLGSDHDLALRSYFKIAHFKSSLSFEETTATMEDDGGIFILILIGPKVAAEIQLRAIPAAQVFYMH